MMCSPFGETRETLIELAVERKKEETREILFHDNLLGNEIWVRVLAGESAYQRLIDPKYPRKVLEQTH